MQPSNESSPDADRQNPEIRPYAAFDVVVIAASLGGLEAVGRVLGALPSDFPAAVLVAQHVHPSNTRYVDRLAPWSALPVRQAATGDVVRPSVVYVAPPDRHLLVQGDRRLLVNRGPKVKFCRPAAEPLFASAAATYRERTLGVVLTGCNTDGAFGAQVIKWMGGRVLAQDPGSARAAGMPRAAIATGQVDFILPLEGIASALIALVMARGAAEWLRVETSTAA